MWTWASIRSPQWLQWPSSMRTEASTQDRSTGEVGVLNKTLDLLEVLAGADGLTVAELAATSGVNKAAAYRILNTLERRGYVVRTTDEVRRYSLGPALRALARESHSPGDLLAAARPLLRRLWEEFDETVNLGVLSQGRVLYLDILESEQGLRTTVTVGSHDDLHSTALGKAMLSVLPVSDARKLLTHTDMVAKTPRTLTSVPELMREIERTRQRGFALDDEENEPGARCVAAAVVDGQGRPLGALSMSGPAWRIDDAMVEKIGRRLREAADEVAAQLI